MSGDFEKNIGHRLEGFQLSPAPQVWERVAAALPEKRRRRFAIWWLLPLAACLGGGLWLIVDRQKGTDNKQMGDATRTTIVTDNNLKKIISRPVDTTGSETPQPYDEQKAVVKENETNILHKQDGFKKESATSYPVKVRKPSLQTDAVTGMRQAEMPTYENALLKRHSGTRVKQTEDLLYVLNPAAGSAAIQKAKNDYIFLNKEPVLPLPDSVTNPSPAGVAKNDTALTKTSDTLAGNSGEIKAPKEKYTNRKVEWSLVMGVGKSSLTDNNSSDDMRKALEAANLNNSGGLSSIPGGFFSNPTAGFNGSVCVVRRQSISKHISWQAGIRYQFLTAKQRVGSRNDSLVQFDALADAAFYRANSTGSNQASSNSNVNVQGNRVHRLQLTPGLLYTLNPQDRSPFRFHAGVTIAYTISNHILLHDYRSGSYIRSAKLSNKIMFGGEAGIDMLINHNIQAGLFYQHDFTNVARAKVGSTFRWNQLQFRIGIPLSKYR